MEHLGSTLQAADDHVLWEEIRNFKKCLHRLAASLEGEAIFLETALPASQEEQPDKGFGREISFRPSSAMSSSRTGRAASKFHTVIHALVVPRDRPDPRTFFRQVLREADEEWHQHPRVLETGPKGGLRRTIPAGNFPFVYADFALDAGFAHVIENRRFVGEDFLLAAAADLLGLDWHARRRVQASAQDARHFRTQYQSFDWTHLLRTQP